MPRGIDHLVLAVRDLGAAASTYGSLGFRVGGRNRHPWGTENHIVQLDGSFLELVGLGSGFERLDEADPAAPFANTLAGFLQRRDGGLAQVALHSLDALADAHVLAGAGLGHGQVLRFGRTTDAEDGHRRELSFTLAFAAGSAGAAPEFFLCQHHRPENFWAPALQQHPNGARGLLGVVMAADAPNDRRHLLQTLFGPDSVTGTRDAVTAAAGAQTVEVVRPDRARARYGADLGGEGLVCYRLHVGSLDAVSNGLDRAGLPYSHHERGLVIGPAVAHGVALSFEPVPPGDVS